ncbi:asparagine synthetase domain-containing protein CG17486 [Uranotaenia lowii]|uniref:asparagine synthetase domain-containing protein CG17486 n=1 Tax=Uranotaenia lowii TaxID=190385 RepID=UPI002478FB88|nr:asparagine synthetase domain-containing protein CG17486 [Uranotaenia lowii]
MCGICCFISYSDTINTEIHEIAELHQLLKNRGPDFSGRFEFKSRVLLDGNVLWQQGNEPCLQPIEEERFVLLFNGDAFVERDNLDESDTRWLFRKIQETSDECDLGTLFKTLKGPFSLILLDKLLERIYFARDSLGRNSLLISSSEEGILLSSVLGTTSSFQTVELPPVGLFYIDFERCNKNEQKLFLRPWKNNDEEILSLDLVLRDSITLPWFQPIENKYDFDFHQLLDHYDALDSDALFEQILQETVISMLCEDLIKLLTQSVRERVRASPSFCKDCIENKKPCQHSSVGILFSGGLDCSILALLADEFVDPYRPIDLLNVAFEKLRRPPKTGKTQPSPSDINWNVPDRQTGKSTVEELQNLRPNRQWNFVEINITRQTLSDCKRRITDLVFPLKSVLDESLGSALWFASRGQGLLNGEEYQCPARVLLLGSGADELFGGYSRHRAAFYRNVHSTDKANIDQREAFLNLSAELELDWQRLPTRNLARDDRIICDNRITPRTPYLQEDFVALVKSLQANQRCYHPLGSGLGDKLILRLCGYRLGLKRCAFYKKRALQFGSRIADSKQNANDESKFLRVGE